MTTVAVIGSNSFSASHFIDLLLASTTYRVIGISRSPEKNPIFRPYTKPADPLRYEFHRLDLNKDMSAIQHILTSTQPAYVVNFASQSEVAPSWDYPEQWFQTNAVAVAELGNFLRKQNWLTRYVHISTPEVYGSCTDLAAEDARFYPTTPYAASRAAGELMLFTLVKQYAFPLVVIRSANVYGAHQQLHKIIPRTILYLRQGRVLPLHGGGTQLRSFIHIRDVSRGELAAMETGQPGAIYNLAPANNVSIRDLVKMICARLGKDFADFTEVVAARPGQDAAYMLDWSMAREQLGWKAKVSLQDGIDEVLAWIDLEWDFIANQPLEYVHKP